MPSKIDTLQKIELAEGVEILLRPAGPCVRMMAWFIDFWISGLWMLGASLIGALAGAAFGERVGQGLILLGIFFVNWFYFVYYEVRRGDSPGKKSMGLRVVRTSGAAVGWGASIVRNFLRVVDFLPFGYLFGVVTSTCNRKFQRLGDLVADTVVVHDRPDIRDTAPPLAQPVTGSVPPAVLDREEQLALVQFIDRAGLWTESRREELANILSPVTRATGREGVNRTLSMGAWLRDS